MFASGVLMLTKVKHTHTLSLYCLVNAERSAGDRRGLRAGYETHSVTRRGKLSRKDEKLN